MRILIDLDDDVLKFFEQEGKADQRKRKQQIEHILTKYARKKQNK